MLRMESLSKVFDLGNVYMVLYSYAVLKYLKIPQLETATAPLKLIKFLCRICLTILLTIIAFITLLRYALYAEYVSLLLRIKYGRNFLGLMNGTDAIWQMKSDKGRCIISALFLIEMEQNQSPEILLQYMIEMYSDLCQTHYKLSCIREDYKGYCYFKKIDIDVEKCVRYLRDYENLDDFYRLMDKIGPELMPYDDKGMFSIEIGKRLVTWEKRPNQVPLLVRYHHCLGDGISIISMHLANMVINGLSVMRQKCDMIKELNQRYLNKHKGQKPKNLFNKLKYNLEKQFSRDIFINCFAPAEGLDENCLRGKIAPDGKPMSGQKIMVWSLETPGSNYIAKVKSIKDSFDGVSFTDVVLTAFSASLAEYVRSVDENPPKIIRMGVPLFIKSGELNNIVKLVNNKPITNMSNDFSLATIRMPTCDKTIDDDLIKRLLEVSKAASAMKKSLDYHFMYWQLNCLTSILPMDQIRKSLDNTSVTLGMSNIPGNPKVHLNMGNGHLISDMIVWAPNLNDTGITLTVFSYDDLFRFTVVVDKSRISRRDDVQHILDKIFYYIDAMYIKICQK